MKTSRNAFTLIEMLVVIAIIGILASLIFPAINKALLQAKISKARQETHSVASAITLYFNDNTQLPVPLADQALVGYSGVVWQAAAEDAGTYFTDAVSRSIIQVLIAEPKGDNLNHVLNPKKKVYLSMQGAKSTGDFLDPWGIQYRIKLDRDYDNKVEYYNQPDQHRTRVVVVSAGPDRLWSGGASEKNAKDNVANVPLVNVPQ